MRNSKIRTYRCLIEGRKNLWNRSIISLSRFGRAGAYRTSSEQRNRSQRFEERATRKVKHNPSLFGCGLFRYNPYVCTIAMTSSKSKTTRCLRGSRFSGLFASEGSAGHLLIGDAASPLTKALRLFASEDLPGHCVALQATAGLPAPYQVRSGQFGLHWQIQKTGQRQRRATSPLYSVP